jgi:iron complex transport system substrate-binding protein
VKKKLKPRSVAGVFYFYPRKMDTELLSYTDQIGRTVALPARPQRIISLCPSLTETLLHFGLGERIVGRTHFCIHPADTVASILAVGGTKNLKEDRVLALQPDLVICEKEENTREMVEWLESRFPTYVTDVRDIPSAIEMIRCLGTITDCQAEGEALAAEVEAAFAGLPSYAGAPSVLYFIWRKPWMVAGQDTYIDALLQRLGLRNLAASFAGRYPALELEQLAGLSPDFVWLSSEPFPFKEQHIAELRGIFPGAEIRLVDGEMFSWYGCRMLAVPGYVKPMARQNER